MAEKSPPFLIVFAALIVGLSLNFVGLTEKVYSLFVPPKIDVGEDYFFLSSDITPTEMEDPFDLILEQYQGYRILLPETYSRTEEARHEAVSAFCNNLKFARYRTRNSETDSYTNGTILELLVSKMRSEENVISICSDEAWASGTTVFYSVRNLSGGGLQGVDVKYVEYKRPTPFFWGSFTYMDIQGTLDSKSGGCNFIGRGEDAKNSDPKLTPILQNCAGDECDFGTYQPSVTLESVPNPLCVNTQKRGKEWQYAGSLGTGEAVLIPIFQIYNVSWYSEHDNSYIWDNITPGSVFMPHSVSTDGNIVIPQSRSISRTPFMMPHELSGRG